MNYEKIKDESFYERKEMEKDGRDQKFNGMCGPRDGFTFIIVFSMIFSIGVTVALIVDILYGQHQIGHAAITTENEICSRIGLDLMKQGGSAVDAAIGASLCLGVTNSESSGIGGGGFMIIEGSDGSQEVIDYRCVAPAASDKNMFNENQELSSLGGLSVAVPGQMKGLELAHSRHGRLPWSKIVDPVISLANNGFPLSKETSKKINLVKKDILKIEKSKLGRIYVPDGKVLKPGSWINRPDLARTLKNIRDYGSNGFYSGYVADNILEKVKSYGGIITAEDLTSYRPILKRVIHTDYKGYRILTSPAPSGGPLLILAINILKSLNISMHDSEKPVTYHLMAEAFKFAFAKRGGLGDPGFVDIRNITRKLLSQSFADVVAKNISVSQTFSLPHYQPMFDQSLDRGTSQISVIGPRGNIVSISNSINTKFGSKIMTDTGILLNSDMNDFSLPGRKNDYGLEPSKANYIKGGKRPLSSMTPVIVLNKNRPCEEQIAMGGAGGARIITGIVESILNYVLFDKSFSLSLDRGRIHHQLIPDVLEIEGSRFSSDMKDRLVSRLTSLGHTVEDNPGESCILSGVLKQKKHLITHIDSRVNVNGGYSY